MTDELSLGARGLLACLLSEMWADCSTAAILSELEHPECFGFGKKEADEVRAFILRTKDDFKEDDE